MKKLAVLAVLVMSVLSVMAQSTNQIKESGEYYWGEGSSDESMDKADNYALADLSEQISTKVFAKSEIDMANEQSGKGAKSSVKFSKVMKSYSSAVLTNTVKMVLEEGPKHYRMLRYVKKADVDTIFALRRARIVEFVNIANRSLKELQINGALRYYYWAHLLTQSLNKPNEAKVTDETGAEYMANVWLPKRINDVFSKLSNEVLRTEGNTLELGFFYDDKPVASLDFTYFDGSGQSAVYTVKDGKASLEFPPGNIPVNFSVNYQYEYLEEAIGDEEMKMVVDAMVSASPFPKARASVKTTKPIKTTSESYANMQALEKRVPNLESDATSLTSRRCNEVMQKVITAIRTKNYYTIQDLFTDAGYDVYTRLVGYGSARLIGEPKLSYTTLNGNTYCRSVPMSFTFSRRRQFAEDVVFVFDEEGKIDDVSFSLGKIATNDIIDDSQGWTMEAKNVLINFLETYKTAYALKRLDYLEQVFAKDALIITGKVLNKTNRKFNDIYSNNKVIEKKEYTKKEYIEHLRKVFGAQEFINIKFANNMVKKASRSGMESEIYGIQIRQDYFSGTYGDSGYLFIVVDLTQPDEPVIRVRAWQEELDYTWGKYGLEMF